MKTLALSSLIAPSRKIIRINLCAMFALAGSVTAEIGDTIEQVDLNARRDKEVVKIRGPYPDDNGILIETDLRNGCIVGHVFEEQGRGFATAMYVAFPWRLTTDDIHAVQKGTGLKWEQEASDMWEATNGLVMAVKQGKGMSKAKGKDVITVFVPHDYIVWPPDGKPGTKLVFGPHATPEPVRTPKPAQPDKKDCLIVATETLARLKHTAYWARIIGFEYGNAKLGHAAVVYQPGTSSNVWLYDESGSHQLRTQSHDLDALRKAINEILPPADQLSVMQWVD